MIGFSFFLTKDKSLKDTLNESIKVVLDRELADLGNGVDTNVATFNDTFLKTNANNYECVVEATKIAYDLDPTESGANKALGLLTDFKNKTSSISLKVYTLV